MTSLDLQSKFQKVVDVVRQDLMTIRTGRATPQLLENVLVEAYGMKMKLVELASITASDAQNLIATPFDPDSTGAAIVKAIENAGMGFTPVVNENVVRVIIPPLSQERREEFAKLASIKVEGGKVMVRQIRHEAMEEVEKMGVDEDTQNRLEKEIQNLTGKYTAEIETLGKQKEEELRQV